MTNRSKMIYTYPRCVILGYNNAWQIYTLLANIEIGEALPYSQEGTRKEDEAAEKRKA